jgi:hypothetical protein
MTKKKQQELVWEEEDEVEDEFTEDQYEYSYEMANEYIAETLLPDLITFDLENEDEDYVPGTALFASFIQIASILLENGFTPQQLH